MAQNMQNMETAGTDIHFPVGELCRPGERIDDLQRNGLRILQDPARFCFGMDAVLLASYVQMKKARRALDLGTGNGILPLLLSARTDCARLTGLEIQPASADLAARSVALNGLEDRIDIVQGDIREAGRLFKAASFDFITCNPPYRPVGAGRVSGKKQPADVSAVGSEEQKLTVGTGGVSGKKQPADVSAVGSEEQKLTVGIDRISGKKQPASDVKTAGQILPADTVSALDPRAIARHELLCTLDDVVSAAAKLLRPGGHFYLVHRPLRLAEILTKLTLAGLEPKRMRLVYPHVDEAPNMVLLDCVRGGAPELRVEPPLIVYEKDGSYTPELRRLYYED